MSFRNCNSRFISSFSYRIVLRLLGKLNFDILHIRLVGVLQRFLQMLLHYQGSSLFYYFSLRFIDAMYETPHLLDVVHFPFHKGELFPRGVPLRQLIYRLYRSNFCRNLCHSCGIVRGLFAYIVPSGKARKNEIGSREICRR